LIEAGARVVIAMILPIAMATAASPVISVVAIGSILAWTVLYTALAAPLQPGRSHRVEMRLAGVR